MLNRAFHQDRRVGDGFVANRTPGNAVLRVALAQQLRDAAVGHHELLGLPIRLGHRDFEVTAITGGVEIVEGELARRDVAL
ncbi:hypothetical protein D3C85_1440780 [compost metagenome]